MVSAFNSHYRTIPNSRSRRAPRHIAPGSPGARAGVSQRHGPDCTIPPHFQFNLLRHLPSFQKVYSQVPDHHTEGKGYHSGRSGGQTQLPRRTPLQSRSRFIEREPRFFAGFISSGSGVPRPRARRLSRSRLYMGWRRNGRGQLFLDVYLSQEQENEEVSDFYSG